MWEISPRIRKGRRRVSLSKVIRASDSRRSTLDIELIYFLARASTPRQVFSPLRIYTEGRGSTAKRSARWTLIRWGGGGRDIKGGPPREDPTKPPLRGGGPFPLLHPFASTAIVYGENNKLSSFVTLPLVNGNNCNININKYSVLDVTACL